MIIEFSEESLLDLSNIRDYIAADNPPAAERTVTRLLQSIRHLEHFPELGSQWQHGPTRALSVPGLPYRVIYEVQNDRIWIMTIAHMSRKLPN